MFQVKRKSNIDIGTIYFWTATINQWQHLLKEDDYKEVIISSLQFLSITGKIDVFAFIIMPNHIHLIWRMNEMNGKESPHSSFLKFTAHHFKHMVQTGKSLNLETFAVKAPNKAYEFWQRDSLAIPLFTKKVALQKLNYLHNNPLAEHWNLVHHPCDYRYSSAPYYERDQKHYEFLKDLWEEF